MITVGVCGKGENAQTPTNVPPAELYLQEDVDGIINVRLRTPLSDYDFILGTFIEGMGFRFVGGLDKEIVGKYFPMDDDSELELV